MSNTKKAVDKDEMIYNMAALSCEDVQERGIDLSIPDYIDYLETVVCQLHDMLNNSKSDLKRQQGE